MITQWDMAEIGKAPGMNAPKRHGKRLPSGADGLTEKQRAYVAARASGAGKLAAYVAAYDVESSNQDTHRSNASRIEASPAVQAALARATEMTAQGMAWDAAKLRAFVVDRLLTEAVSANHATARIRALELLGKHGGMWAGAGEDDSPELADVAALRARIGAKLREMLGDDVPSPGSSSSVAAPPERASASASAGSAPGENDTGGGPGEPPLTRA